MEGLAAVEADEAIVASEAWCTKRYMFSTATPTNLVASPGENVVVDVDIGAVPVIEIRAPVIACPPIVHVPETVPTSTGG